LQFFPTAEESMDYYNQKRCVDGKGLVLPSQIVSLLLAMLYYDGSFIGFYLLLLLISSIWFFQRYVKYFERILTYFNGENQPGRRYILFVYYESLLSVVIFLSQSSSVIHGKIVKSKLCPPQMYAQGISASQMPLLDQAFSYYLQS